MGTPDRGPVTAASLRGDLERAFKAKHITVDPAGAAELAMSVVLPHLRGMAAEIERQRDLLAEYVLKGKSGSEEEKP